MLEIWAWPNFGLVTSDNVARGNAPPSGMGKRRMACHSRSDLESTVVALQSKTNRPLGRRLPSAGNPIGDFSSCRDGERHRRHQAVPRSCNVRPAPMAAASQMLRDPGYGHRWVRLLTQSARLVGRPFLCETRRDCKKRSNAWDKPLYPSTQRLVYSSPVCWGFS